MGEDIGEDIEVVRIVGGGIIGGVYNTRESVLYSYVPHKSCNEHTLLGALYTSYHAPLGHT